MPRVDKTILDCSIYLYPSEQDAIDGTRAGGSGFLVAIPYKTKINDVLRSHVYAVTNSHVIREAGSPVIRLNSLEGRKDTIPLGADDWTDDFYGPDVAVCLLDDQAIVSRYRAVMVLPPERDGSGLMMLVGLGIGSDTLTVGRFVSHEGKQKNLPVVRFGNVAMMNYERIEHPDRPGNMQEVFLVEGRSTSGMSGSPVFMTKPDSQFQDEIEVTDLIGIEMGHMNVIEPLRDADGNKHSNDDYVQVNSGMMMVVPAWHLWMLLFSREFEMRREEIEKDERKKARKKGGVAASDAATPDVFTKEDFEKALRIVSRPIEPEDQPDEGKSET